MKPVTVLSGRHVTVSGPVGEGHTVDISAQPLAGSDLATLVAERGPLEHAAVIAVGSHVAAALAAAHNARAIHGHLSPESVVISGAVEGQPDSGAVQVGGFGVGAAPADSPYLAPEQVAGQDGDARSDLYGLGCLFMVMLTGEPPAPPAHDRPSGSAEPAPQTGAPWPSDRRSDVDPALNGLVHDLLAVSPARRPVSAHEVTSRLGRIAADLRERQVPVALPVTAAATPAVTSEASSSDTSPVTSSDISSADPAVTVAFTPEAAPADLPSAPLPESAESFGLVALGLGASQEGPDEASRTQPIPAVTAGEDDGPRNRWGAILASTPVPWTWLVGSAAAVLLVMVALLGALLGGGDDSPVAGAPASPTLTPSTPSATEATGASPTTGSAPTSTVPTTVPTTTATTTSPAPTSAAPSATSAPTRSRPAPQPATLADAVTDLRATVRRVVSNGEVTGGSGAELVRRADDLSRWVGRNEAQLSRRAADLGRFLDQLANSGQITSAAYREVSSALAAVRSRL